MTALCEVTLSQATEALKLLIKSLIAKKNKKTNSNLKS
jgi:hypothetical protein